MKKVFKVIEGPSAATIGTGDSARSGFDARLTAAVADGWVVYGSMISTPCPGPTLYSILVMKEEEVE